MIIASVNIYTANYTIARYIFTFIIRLTSIITYWEYNISSPESQLCYFRKDT